MMIGHVDKRDPGETINAFINRMLDLWDQQNEGNGRPGVIYLDPASFQTLSSESEQPCYPYFSRAIMPAHTALIMGSQSEWPLLDTNLSLSLELYAQESQKCQEELWRKRLAFYRG